MRTPAPARRRAGWARKLSVSARRLAMLEFALGPLRLLNLFGQIRVARRRGQLFQPSERRGIGGIVQSDPLGQPLDGGRVPALAVAPARVTEFAPCFRQLLGARL